MGSSQEREVNAIKRTFIDPHVDNQGNQVKREEFDEPRELDRFFLLPRPELIQVVRDQGTAHKRQASSKRPHYSPTEVDCWGSVFKNV
jgi:hypothetical protein